MTGKNETGVCVDLLRRQKMSGMSGSEKIRHIIDLVKEGRIVVLEHGLEPDEEALLIEKTMIEIDHDDFKGVDVESYSDSNKESRSYLDKLLGRKNNSKSDLTVIGPAAQMETLHKDDNQISTLLKKK